MCDDVKQILNTKMVICSSVVYNLLWYWEFMVVVNRK